MFIRLKPGWFSKYSCNYIAIVQDCSLVRMKSSEDVQILEDLLSIMILMNTNKDVSLFCKQYAWSERLGKGLIMAKSNGGKV